MSSIVAIGDVQGCAQALDQLLATLPDNSRLWFAGDLVNRGPDSLTALRRVRGLRDAITVLGNHDLHLLAAASGARAPGRGDTLQAILNSSERDDMVDWLRRQPLAHAAENHLLVHAGVDPAWDLETSLALAAEVEHVLRGPNWGDFMTCMYGDSPDRWDDSLSGDDRLRAIVNILTRARFMHVDGRYAMKPKGGPADAPKGLRAWFDMPSRRILGEACVVFGHWSTLGLMLRDDVVALDTGCVWGGQLSAVTLPGRQVFQVACPRAQDPMPG